MNPRPQNKSKSAKLVALLNILADIFVVNWFFRRFKLPIKIHLGIAYRHAISTKSYRCIFLCSYAVLLTKLRRFDLLLTAPTPSWHCDTLRKVTAVQIPSSDSKLEDFLHIAPDDSD